MLDQLKQDPAFQNVDGPVARFIDTAVNMGLSEVIDMEGATVNMCIGMQRLVDRGEEKAKQIVSALLAGTPDAEICLTFDITKEHLNTYKMLFPSNVLPPASP